MNLNELKAKSINNYMQKDSKLIAEAYFKKLNEGMRVIPARTSPEQQPPKEENEESQSGNHSDKMSIMQKILKGEHVSPMILSKLTREELLIILADISKKLSSSSKPSGKYFGYTDFDEDDESADKTEQDPNDKSSIDYAREDKAAAERDKWTQGQGVGGKFHF